VSITPPGAALSTFPAGLMPSRSDCRRPSDLL